MWFESTFTRMVRAQNDARLAPQSAITRSLHFHAECAHSVVFFFHRMKIDVTGGEASSIMTNWPAAVTFPQCAQIDDQRSGRWHTTDGARGKAAMAYFSENLHGHAQSEGCDDLCYSVTQVVATSGRTILSIPPLTVS